MLTCSVSMNRIAADIGTRPWGILPGVGKSWLACALGHKACRDNRSVLYQRVPKLFGDLALARGDGRYPRQNAVIEDVDYRTPRGQANQASLG